MSGEPTSDRRIPWLYRTDTLGPSLGLYLPANALARGLGFGRNIVLTWLICEAEYGMFQVALAAIAILHPLCSMGVFESLARYVPQYETRGAIRAFLVRTIPMAVGIALVLTGVVYFVAEPISTVIFATRQQAEADGANRVALTRLVSFAVLGVILFFMTMSVLKGLRMFRAVSLLEVVGNGGFAVLAIVVALAGWRTAEAVITSYGLAMMTAVALLIPGLIVTLGRLPGQSVSLAEAEREHDHAPLVDRVLRFSIWAAMAAIMWQALQYLPVWFLHKACGGEGETTGVFGGARLVSQVVLLGTAAFLTVIQTSVFRTWEARGADRADDQLMLAFKAVGLVMLTLCVVLSAVRQWVMMVLPIGYGAAADVMPILLLFFLISGYLSFLGIHFSLIEKARHLFAPWSAGVVASVFVASWLLKPGMSAFDAWQAASWASVVSVSVSLAVCLLLMHVEHRPIDIGSCILLVVSYTLLLPIERGAVPALIVIWLLTLATPLVLDRGEKKELRERFGAGWNRVSAMLGRG